MNIFRLDDDPHVCAQYHNDRHVVKMVTEYCQLLSTAHRCSGSDYDELYQSTHVNHPSNIWIRQGRDNYAYVYQLLCELVREFDYRFDSTKHQRAKSLLDVLSKTPKRIPVGGTPMLLAMPAKYEHPSPVSAYRSYYIGDKQHLAVWSGRSVTEWYIKVGGVQ